MDFLRKARCLYGVSGRMVCDDTNDLREYFEVGTDSVTDKPNAQKSMGNGWKGPSQQDDYEPSTPIFDPEASFQFPDEILRTMSNDTYQVPKSLMDYYSALIQKSKSRDRFINIAHTYQRTSNLKTSSAKFDECKDLCVNDPKCVGFNWFDTTDVPGTTEDNCHLKTNNDFVYSKTWNSYVLVPSPYTIPQPPSNKRVTSPSTGATNTILSNK